jgi:hypothetical protein
MGLFKKKWTNLQPWLDYFKVLQKYESNGYLEVSVNKGEAYITQAALYTLVAAHIKSASAKEVIRTAKYIRAYVAWKGRFGGDWLEKPFALQVVKDDAPHDPVFTLLLSRKRRWWKLWLKANVVDVINY